MNSETVTTANNTDKQPHQYLVEGNYIQAAHFYEQAIVAEPTVTENYWYLGLSLLLQDQEEEAEFAWLSGVTVTKAENMDGSITELIAILSLEAQRQEILTNYRVALKIRQHLHELIPNDADNLFKLTQLSLKQNILPIQSATLNLEVEESDFSARLDEIPSETTPAERRYIYNFFSSIWSGESNVCEIGPFLGGTTRAIALGMSENPKYKKQFKLYTYDKFNQYYSKSALINYLTPLFDSKVLDESHKYAIETSDTFSDIFKTIHGNESYSDLILINEKRLPNTPEECSLISNLFKIDQDIKFDAIFVDGCKSWYALKYFIIQIINHIEPGSYFIFQDYCCYTCFWIPVFLWVMRKSFRLFSYVDTTYTFQLRKKISSDSINQLYPDNPHVFDKLLFDNIFAELAFDAVRRQDITALIFHTIQHGGALAYIGYTDESRAKIATLINQPWARNYQYLIRKALISPTYQPDGKPIYL